MKDIILPVKRQKTEIKIFCTCIILAYLLNIISIISYGTEWSELWTQSLWMLILSYLLYGLSIAIRLFYLGIRKIVAGKNRSNNS